MIEGLVTLPEVKRGLRIDDAYSDEDLMLKISAASQAVATFIKSASFIATNGVVDLASVPADVKAATILLVGYLHDGFEAGDFERGYLPTPVTALLYPYRDPTLA